MDFIFLKQASYIHHWKNRKTHLGSENYVSGDFSKCNKWGYQSSSFGRGQVAEIYVEQGGDERIIGNIYKGIVNNVLPGMQAAFVDIGLERMLFYMYRI